MASLTLAALIDGESSLHILNHRPPTLDRVVSAVHLAAYSAKPLPHDPCSPDVLWIIPGFPEPAHVEFDAWILQLAQTASAGLIVPETRLAASTILLADRLAFPLLSIPPWAMDRFVYNAWSQMTMQAFYTLQQDQSTIDHITDLWAKAGNAQEFVDALDALGLPMGLDEDRNLREPTRAGQALLAWGRGRGMRLHTNVPISPRVFAHVQLLAAILLDREAGEIESQLRHRSEFLLELLVNPGVPTGSVIRAAEQFHLDLGRHHTIALWDLDAFGHFVSQGIPESSVLRLKSQILQQLEKESRSTFGHGLVLAHSDEFVLIVESHEALTAQQFTPQVRAIQHALVPILIRYRVAGITAGLGYSYTGVQGLRKSFEEAHEAMVVGRSRSGLGSVTHFGDMGLERFLYGWIDSPRSQMLAESFLTPLTDDPNGKELLHTLQVYLECRGRVSLASQTLAIHRNTLRYRLDRVQQILRIDVDDVTAQLVLQLAFKALNLDAELHKK